MSSEPAITLYDITSNLSPQAWSPNTWKARTVLNYKRIPYKTEWVSYPDIEPTIKKLGGTPTSTKRDDPTKDHYTLPAIVDTSNGTPIVITDSLAITEYLDEKYPDRPVFPKEGKALEIIFDKFIMATFMNHLPPIMMPLSWAILDERGQVYFRETRERWYGKKLEEFSPEGPVREGHWEAIKLAFDQVATALDKNGSDVDWVAGGSEPTRADMILVSYLAWIKVIAPEEGWSRRIQHWNDGIWERLWNRSEEWRVVH